MLIIVQIVLYFYILRLVHSFTHVSPSGSSSTIDLAFVSDSSTVLLCDTVPPLSTSDHNGILLDLKLSGARKHCSGTTRLIWDYKHADSDKANVMWVSACE